MNKYKIREFIPEKNKDDFEQLLPAFLDIWNEPKSLRFLSFTQKPFTEETIRYWFSNHLKQGGHYFVAINDDEVIVGIAVIKINLIETFELFGLGVRSEFKRQGIGSQLIEYSIKNATDLSFKVVDVGVFADNITMLRLLLSKSFIPVRMDYNRRYDGTDILRLRRFL